MLQNNPLRDTKLSKLIMTYQDRSSLQAKDGFDVGGGSENTNTQGLKRLSIANMTIYILTH